MKWLQAGAACFALFAASYAWAGPPEGYLGRGVDASGGPPSAAGAAGVGPLKARSSGGSVKRYAAALDRLAAAPRAATRGAKESHVYAEASPSVVLVITKEALGSGVLISADGKIVTNLHVVGDNAEVGVIFKPKVEGASVDDADVHRAKVLKRDEVADLALIQVSELPAHVKPLALGSSAAVQIGEDVNAIGHPTGEAWTFTRGIVSQIRRDYAWTAEDKLQHKATVIQTQTPINPGNSGGPLIDDNLQLIGINSFKTEGEGLNFAVSVEDVKAFLARAGDRVTEHPKPVDPANCKSKALKERASDDPPGKELLVDEDCDGKGDFIAILPDDRSLGITMLYDDDGDGKIDAALFDKNWDGYPESGLYDTNGDGKFDMTGRFHKGDKDPYRYDRIKD
jgi:S1-C subfamily serine protease